MNTVVLGAGIAGLGYLNSYMDKENIVVYEKDSRPGGLCKSFNVKGFIFDSAVHLSFTNFKKVRDVFDKTDYIRHTPIAYNFYEGKYVKHPVIYNLHAFLPEQRCNYIEVFLKREKYKEVRNYGEWLLASYGSAIKTDFYDKYTKKYWTLNSEEMSTSWLGSRLQEPDIHKILMGAFEESKDVDYYAKEMRYPTQGGYEAFLKPLLKTDNIVCNKEVVRIDSKARRVYFRDGESVRYEKLVSSLPLNDIINMIDDSPTDIKEAAKRLKYSKISLVSMGIRKPDVVRCLWMYIYDLDIMAARVNCPSVKSANNVPCGYSSLQFEIYHDSHEIVRKETVIENVLYAVRKMRICEEKDIEFIDYRLLPYGNVIFYEGMEKDRKMVKDFLMKKDIYLIGRFGEWDYFWSDQSFMSGCRGTECL